MDVLFEEKVKTANLFLQTDQWAKSIAYYEEALELAPTVGQKINLYTVLGRLFQKLKKPARAIAALEAAFQLYEDDSEYDKSPDKASILNNLAALYLETNPSLGIDYYKAAREIFLANTVSEHTAYYPHLANTNFAMAEAYNRTGDWYSAKKYFKEAITQYDQLLDVAYDELKARAFYYLGNIYSEEFKLEEANLNYLNSKILFERLALQNEESYRPLLAAVLNNMGVTFKSMGNHQKALAHYEQALQHYQHLAEHRPLIFRPYLAATYNSLAILCAEQKMFEKAVEFTQKSSDIYNELANETPEEYTHYLATSIHNLALLYFELKEIELAKQHFKQSLAMRKKLAMMQPDAFHADVCATTLNLVELYQTEMENTLDMSMKPICLELLNDVDQRLQTFEELRPVLKSMKSDYQYYCDYFNTITIEKLQLDDAFRKVGDLTEEINSTIKVNEKIKYQQRMVDILENLYEHYPNHEKLMNELVDAYSDLSWLHLRTKNYALAESVLLKAMDIAPSNASLNRNMAHSYLLQNKYTLAKSAYLQYIDDQIIDNQPYRAKILGDFNKLISDGISADHFDKIKRALQL